MGYKAREWENNKGLPLNADNLNIIEKGIEDCSKSIEDLSKQIFAFLTPEDLWKNDSPNTAFAEQEIIIGLENYKRISILFKFSTSESGMYFEFQHSFKGEKICVCDGGAYNPEYSYVRDVTFSDDGVLFSSCKRETPTSSKTNNAYMIPVKIIGYKY